MSRYFGAVTRMCFEPHGMFIVIQKVTFYILPNGRTLLIQRNQDLFCAAQYNKIGARKTQTLEENFIRTSEEIRTISSPIVKEEKSGNQHILSQSVSISKHYVYICICNNREFSSYYYNRVNR